MKDLSEMELRKIDGGVLWWVVLIVAAGISGVVTDWPGFKKGIIAGVTDSDY